MYVHSPRATIGAKMACLKRPGICTECQFTILLHTTYYLLPTTYYLLLTTYHENKYKRSQGITTYYLLFPGARLNRGLTKNEVKTVGPRREYLLS